MIERIRLRHLERRIIRRVHLRQTAAQVKPAARAPIPKLAAKEARSYKSVRAALEASAAPSAPVILSAPAAPPAPEAPSAPAAPASSATPTPTTTQVPKTLAPTLPPALVAIAIAQGINLDELLALTPDELADLEAYLGLT